MTSPIADARHTPRMPVASTPLPKPRPVNRERRVEAALERHAAREAEIQSWPMGELLVGTSSERHREHVRHRPMRDRRRYLHRCALSTESE